MHVIHRGHKNVDHEGWEILVCLLADVTETVKLQEELESKAADLEDRNRDLQTLTENVPGDVSIMRMDGEFTFTLPFQTKDMPEDQIGSVDDNDDVEVRKPTFHGEVLVCEDDPNQPGRDLRSFVQSRSHGRRGR